MDHVDGGRQGQEGAMERNASLFVSLGVSVVNHRPTTVDVSLDLGETPTKGPLKVCKTSALICDPVHFKM